MVLHACAHTAPHSIKIKTVAVAFESAGNGAGVVSHAAGFGVLRRKNVVVECTLEVIHMAEVAFGLKCVERHFQHVVGVAGLTRGVSEALGGLPGASETLIAAVAADAVDVTAVGHVEKVFCCLAAHFVASELILTRCALESWGLEIGVTAIEHIMAVGDVEYHLLMVETARDIHIALVAGHCIEVGENGVHAAMLNVEVIVESGRLAQSRGRAPYGFHSRGRRREVRHDIYGWCRKCFRMCLPKVRPSRRDG